VKSDKGKRPALFSMPALLLLKPMSENVVDFLLIALLLSEPNVFTV
jgi:hypothetical protein